MKKLKNNPVAVVCVLVCLCAAALIAFVTVYASPPATTIQACYNNTNGELRRVSSAADCRKHETAISWNITGPEGPQGPPGVQGPPGPGGTELDAFRHTHTVANECVSPSAATFSVLDHASTNGNADALIFVTALIGINGDRSNNNPNSNLLVIYTGSATFGTCPAERWIIGGGDVTTGAQFNVMVVNP